MTALTELSESLAAFMGDDPVLGARARAAADALRVERLAVDLEEARDAAVRLVSCDESELASELSTSLLQARRLLEELEHRGIIRLVAGPRGRRWYYRSRVEDTTRRRRHEPIEQVTVRRMSGPIAGINNRPRRTGGNTSYNQFLARARRAGAKIRHLPGGHIEIAGPNGKVTSASTPGASRFPKQLKQLREVGLDV